MILRAAAVTVSILALAMTATAQEEEPDRRRPDRRRTPQNWQNWREMWERRMDPAETPQAPEPSQPGEPLGKTVKLQFRLGENDEVRNLTAITATRNYALRTATRGNDGRYTIELAGTITPLPQPADTAAGSADAKGGPTDRFLLTFDLSVVIGNGREGMDAVIHGSTVIAPNQTRQLTDIDGKGGTVTCSLVE